MLVAKSYLIVILLVISPFVWLYLSTFCHELGHFFCAKLVGMSPYQMKVGEGIMFSGKWLFDARIELGILPGVGLTHAYHPQTDWSKLGFLKLKLLVYILGGCLANCTLFVMAVVLYVNSGFSIFLYLSFLEVGSVLSNLIPRDVRMYGMKLPNDGKQLLQILSKDYQQHFKNIFAEYQKVITRYTEDGKESRPLFSNDIRSLQVLMIAYTELVNGQFDKAISLLNQLLGQENTTSSEKAYLLDVLASIVITYRQKQYLAQADSWSQEALRLARNSKTIQGTRGAILIELGQHEQGKQLLLPLTESENDPIDQAISNYYLAKVEHYGGNREQSQNWLKRAEEIGKQIPELRAMFTRLKQELRENQ